MDVREGADGMPPLRSREWFAGSDANAFTHRSWMKNQGVPDRMFDGRPVIGICNTYSELAPCNAHFRDIAEHVRRGVLEAGGFPVEFPVMSLGETMLRPTSMLFRNLVSMDVEESIRANPIDGVVLLCGCDKTTPALLMGAASCDLPTIVVSGGPMLTGRMRGRPIGSGTGVWSMSDDVRAGVMSEADFRAAESCMSRSAGHCNTMGTASTMACMAEALGVTLPGNAAIPAVDARRRVLARDSGVRVVELVRRNVRLSDVLVREAFENAVIVNAAIGGSTNAVIHLLALAGRVGVPLALDDFDELARGVPLLVDLQPSGRFLMEDFFEAGGLPAVLNRLSGLLRADAPTVTGRTIGENNAGAPVWNDEVIRDAGAPVRADAGIAVLRGNLAPDGAVIKPSAASPQLLRHRGRAVVFTGIDDFRARIDDPDLDVDENCVLVLVGAGPKGFPGMPEVGNLSLPRRLLERGVRDMVRISDARMSGTAYGTVVLHVAPEAAAGGPLALVRDGDMIELDVPGRRLHLDVPEEELERRRTEPGPAPAEATGGYQRLYIDHVLQADRGADFDFLVGRRGSAVHGHNH
ncbi:dihydroxy-acid dehydratase [Actinomadura sp. NBRC 104425]|uniref:IlvD/Edd family dehydratase n=1 Tax=Actinomadura sp. NBRC 104425 TaxID=3032204 RepID=UPI0024A5E648|nr:IlvD/Edd family dehydratase [Actinomadura sp. NBRC 104425]GLZ14326.1 dihydroxy-acid dehydratase [Actinomadura sp. NBRC 104425]